MAKVGEVKTQRVATPSPPQETKVSKKAGDYQGHPVHKASSKGRNIATELHSTKTQHRKIQTQKSRNVFQAIIAGTTGLVKKKVKVVEDTAKKAYDGVKEGGKKLRQGFEISGEATSKSAHEVIYWKDKLIKERIAISQETSRVEKETMKFLSPDNQKIVKEALESPISSTLRQNIEKILSDKTYKSLSVENQAKVLIAFARTPNSMANTQNILNLLSSKNFVQLSSEIQGKVLDIFNFAHTDTDRKNLIDLTNRTVNGQCALLDRSNRGNTLIDTLAHITSQPIQNRFTGVTNKELLSNVLMETAHPGRVDQGDRGTCAGTSIQYAIALHRPGDYAYFVSSLFENGNATMVNGDRLEVVPDSVTRLRALDNRTHGERVLQAAIMDYAAGGKYTDDKDTHEGNILGLFNRGGLTSGEEKHAMEAIFGRDFKTYSGTWSDLNPFDSAKDIQQKLEELQRDGEKPIIINLRWGEKKKGAHALIFDRIENGRIYFRNPWGPTTASNGSLYNNPPRRLEDNTTRIESMTIEDFQKWVSDIVY